MSHASPPPAGRRASRIALTIIVGAVVIALLALAISAYQRAHPAKAKVHVASSISAKNVGVSAFLPLFGKGSPAGPARIGEATIGLARNHGQTILMRLDRDVSWQLQTKTALSACTTSPITGQTFACLSSSTEGSRLLLVDANTGKARWLFSMPTKAEAVAALEGNILLALPKGKYAQVDLNGELVSLPWPKDEPKANRCPTASATPITPNMAKTLGPNRAVVSVNGTVDVVEPKRVLLRSSGYPLLSGSDVYISPFPNCNRGAALIGDKVADLPEHLVLPRTTDSHVPPVALLDKVPHHFKNGKLGNPLFRADRAVFSGAPPVIAHNSAGLAMGVDAGLVQVGNDGHLDWRFEQPLAQGTASKLGTLAVSKQGEVSVVKDGKATWTSPERVGDAPRLDTTQGRITVSGTNGQIVLAPGYGKTAKLTAPKVTKKIEGHAPLPAGSCVLVQRISTESADVTMMKANCQVEGTQEILSVVTTDQVPRDADVDTLTDSCRVNRAARTMISVQSSIYDPKVVAVCLAGSL